MSKNYQNILENCQETIKIFKKTVKKLSKYFRKLSGNYQKSSETYQVNIEAVLSALSEDTPIQPFEKKNYKDLGNTFTLASF